MKTKLTQFVAGIKYKSKIRKIFPYVLIAFGLAGLLASAAINVEKSHLLRNPTDELSCNLNPVYSCGSVIMTKQAEIFGFSNELMGLVMFAALITTGIVLLSGAVMKQWFWRLFVAGMAGSMVFVGWFFYQSVYTIGALCIFCTIVWISTWSILLAGYAWTYDEKFLPMPAKGISAESMRWLRLRIAYVWLAGLLLGAALILHHFWYYYGQYFGK